MEASLIEFSEAQGKTRVTQAKPVPPLKMLFPNSSADFGTVILTNYGGGYVEGDGIELRVETKPGAKGLVGSQALTRIYKTEENKASKQIVTGKLSEDSTLVFYPDPAVPQGGSIFHQDQEWELESGALLVLVDGYTAGRIARGEVFDYTQYQSNVRVKVGKTLVLQDHFSSEPAEIKPQSVGSQGDFKACANVFIVGEANSKVFQGLIQKLESDLQALNLGRKKEGKKGLLCSMDSPKPGVSVIRSLSYDLEDMQPLEKLLQDSLAVPEILGENPFLRKY